MSEQVIAQAHLTIIDNNDIESITVEYARNQSTSNAPTSGWSTSRPAWAQGYYIWQRTRIHKSGTSATEDTFGTAVCLTGSTGQTGATGKGITGVETLYATNNSTTTAPTSGWQSQPPTYNSSKPKYWVKVTTTYNSGDPTVVTYLDNGITDAMATAAAANQTANNAKDKADTVESNLNNYITSNNNVITALQTKTKYFWTNLTAHTNGSSGWTKPNYPVGTYAASGISGTTFDEENSSTYGYNTLYSNGIKLRYNAINLGELTGTSLVFYRPSTTAQGSKGMELTSSTLKFYDATGSIAQATFGGTQATISGTINAYDGKIGNDTNNYWYIGNYTDYNQNTSAIIKSIGTASIQLNETNTWRISTNRIHTAWAPETGTDAFKLHFPKFNNSSSVSKYWDYGLHLPTSYGDKFLYVRNASGSETLDNLLNDLDDNGYNYWNYLFWVDGSGNVHAPGFYIGNSTTPIGGGAGTVAERLTQGYGSATQPIYFNNNGVPTNTTYTLNAAGAKGVDTSIGAASTSTNLPTSQAVAAFVEGKGYKTTDQNVQTSQANTTKIYLAGTSTAGTSTGTLKFDSNIYADTTAGALHATTYNGYTLAAASAKGVDTSISAASTSTNLPTSAAVVNLIKQYLPLSGGNVTGSVTFEDSVLADEIITGSLIVNGDSRFVNNAQFDTINGVDVGSSPKFTDTVTTVTVSGSGNAITGASASNGAVTLTKGTTFPTGSGTSGYLTKWTGTNTIGNGPAIGTGTTKFLREDGTWVVPGGTYSLPTASSSTLGGIKVGSGLSISDGVLSHTDTSSQASSSNSGRTYIQSITLDTYGHVTALTTATESVTDTHYTTHLYAGKSDGNANAATTNGNTYLMVLDNTTVRDRRKISGSGAASVTSDANGNITINSPVAITSVSFANGTITFTKSDSTTIPITTDNFVITQASGATALVKLKSGSTTEYEGYSAGGATTAPVYFDTNGHPVAVTSIPASLISGSVTPTSHNHSQIVTVGDQRSTTTVPNDYVNALIFKGLKNKATIGNPSSDTYSYLIGLRGWSDSSGGRSHEIAFNNTGIFVRQESASTANTWDSWYRIYTTGNKPTKSDVGLSNVDNTADANKRIKGANITTTANAVAYYTDTAGTFGSKASANGVLYATAANGALNWGTLPIAQGGTGKTTALAAITNLGGPYILAQGTEITASSNLDTDYATAGTYYAPNSTRSASLSGAVISTNSGFKMITMKGYRDQNILQFANWNDERLFYRYSYDTTVNFDKWYQLVRLPSGDDKKTFAAIGSSTQPIYINSSGIVTLGTSYANATVGKASAANLTTTANAVAYYTNTTGTFGSKASANGALYATAANGTLNWGTLPIAQGGTGLTASPSILTNLGSTTAANVLQASPRPGITGTLGIANGGTGQTTAANAINALLGGLPVWTANPTDSTYFVRQDTAGSASYGKVAFSTIWNYISEKINSSGKYVTVDTAQTLTAAATKTYLGLQTYGTDGIALGVTSGTSVTQKVVTKYDSTLEAIVFSFA